MAISFIMHKELLLGILELALYLELALEFIYKHCFLHNNDHL